VLLGDDDPLSGVWAFAGRYRDDLPGVRDVACDQRGNAAACAAAVLESAVERELIPRNPAKGRGRRVRERAPRRTYLETAAQVAALLDAAGDLDRAAHPACRHVERRAMVATLMFAGLRMGGAGELYCEAPYGGFMNVPY
jgi:hypothetical protein